MKYTIGIILLCIAGCSEKQSSLEVVAVQHIGNGLMHNDPCKTLYREDGNAVAMPPNFKITPVEAIEIANDRLGYSCSNKLGAHILADETSYYIVRLDITKEAIIINGISGSVESQGFMERKK